MPPEHLCGVEYETPPNTPSLSVSSSHCTYIPYLQAQAWPDAVPQEARISLQGIDQEVGILRGLVEVLVFSKVEVIKAGQGHPRSALRLLTMTIKAPMDNIALYISLSMPAPVRTSGVSYFHYFDTYTEVVRRNLYRWWALVSG